MICGKPSEWHHVFYGTANRKLSDEYGYIVPLCAEHHRNGEYSAHRNRSFDLMLKRKAETYFETHTGTRADFIRIFGRSYK